MGKTLNFENIAQLEQSRNLYCWTECELIKVFNSLKCYENETSFISKKVGIYKYVKKLLPCFDVLYKLSNSDSLQSFMSIERMITDNYAILYLLTSFGTSQEQTLRYYLFLLDATKTRTSVLEKFSLNQLSELPEDNIIADKKAKSADSDFSEGLRKIIKEKRLDLLVNNSVLKNCYWKFDKCLNKESNKESYSYKDLYKIARIPDYHAEMIQNYHSAFIHGLGISLMISDNDNIFPHLISTLDFCRILQSLIIKILLSEFEEETKDVIFHETTIEFMNNNWNNWK